MNFLKEHKRLVWSLLGAILIIGAIIYVNVTTYLDMRRANIFDEIYQETSISYVFSQLSGVEEKEREIYDGNLNETGKYKRVINYTSEATPEGYANIVFDFYLEVGNNMSIRFEWQPNSDITIWYLCYYKSNKTFTKKIAIFDEPRKSGEYIDDEVKVKEYLKQYHISSADLDKHYDEIVNKKILADWCSIYDSKFSPENYGEVTVKTQWEKW